MLSFIRYLLKYWLLPVLLTACAQNSAYRTDYTSCIYQHAGDCGANTMHHYSPGSVDEYRLGFIEYSDQGLLRDRGQMHTVLDTYYPIAGKDDVLLVVFVHGWHHNAKPRDTNVDKFRELLKKLAQVESRSEFSRKVLGVYIGWRGESITIPVITHSTFWDRKNTAHNVGLQGVTELLLRLEEIVNVKAAMDASVPRPLNSRLVTIGHSFGGAVLFTSLQQILADRFIDSRPDKSFSSDASGLGDLVVLINPAFEALRYATLYDISQEGCRRYSPGQLPKLAILTSETDYATGWAFPAGRFFSTLFERETTLERHDCNGPGSANKVKLEIDEGEANLKTVGHFEPYITHRLNPAEKPSESTPVLNYHDLQKIWSQQKKSSVFSFENSELQHLGKTVPHNPYLNIQVDTRLIPNHNDIWQNEIISFLRDLIMITTTPGESSRVQIPAK